MTTKPKPELMSAAEFRDAVGFAFDEIRSLEYKKQDRLFDAYAAALAEVERLKTQLTQEREEHSKGAGSNAICRASGELDRGAEKTSRPSPVAPLVEQPKSGGETEDCGPCEGSGKRHSMFDFCNCEPPCADEWGVCAACEGTGKQPLGTAAKLAAALARLHEAPPQKQEQAPTRDDLIAALRDLTQHTTYQVGAGFYTIRGFSEAMDRASVLLAHLEETTSDAPKGGE